MNHNTANGINPVEAPFFEGVVATFEFLLSVWNHLVDREELAAAVREQQLQAAAAASVQRHPE